MTRLTLLASASLLATLPAWGQSITLGPAPVPTVPVTARAPGFSDDSTAGYPTGSTWLTDDLYTSQIATAGAAGWIRTPNRLLPGDQIGLRLSTVALAAAGTDYAVGNTLTLTGGAVLTVATIAGGGTTGPIGTVTLTNPAYHACYNATAGGLAQIATSGSGTGATFTGSFVGPYIYGARLLTVCYRAGKALDLANNLIPLTTINFLPGGLIDYASIDAAFPTPNAVTGGRPAIVTLYDQGINGANATNTVGYGCTIGPLRVVRGMRTIACDGDASQGGPLDSGAPNAITSENLPAAVSVSNQALTLVFVGGVQSLDHKTGLLNVGGNGNPNSGLYNKGYSALPNIGLANGSTAGAVCPGMPYDRDNVVFGVNGPAGSYCAMNGAVGTPAASSTPTAGTITNGELGYFPDGSGYAYDDYDAAIIVPWTMSAAEIAAADASIQTTFGIQRQVHSVVVVDGDSDTDGHGSPGQHGWVRMLGEQLAFTRPDVKIVDTAFFGSTMGGAAANGSPGSRLTEQPLNVLPALDAAYAQGAPNAWVVMGPMGNNDFNRGDTVSAVEGYYTHYCTAVHSHHGLCAVTYFSGSLTAGGSGQALAQWLAASTASTNADADLVIQLTSCPAGSLTCTQSDGLHPNQPNDGFQAQSVLRALLPVLH